MKTLTFDPSLYVTRESALAAIDHVSHYNGPGREGEAVGMLAPAASAVTAPAHGTARATAQDEGAIRAAGAPASISADVASAELRTRALAYLALAEKATPGNLESAQHRDENDGYECPACGGEGTVSGLTYTNYDDTAVGVQFFGVGPEFVANEALYRATGEAAAIIRALLNETKP